MWNTLKSNYVNKALPRLARTATALNVARIGSECICENQIVIGALRNQLRLIRGVAPLAILTWMAKRDPLNGTRARFDFKRR